MVTGDLLEATCIRPGQQYPPKFVWFSAIQSTLKGYDESRAPFLQA